MKSVDALVGSARFVTVCTPDACGRLIGKRRSMEDWTRLAAHGLPVPDFHLVTGIENRPLGGFAVAGLEHGFRNGLLKPDAEASFVSPLEAETLHVLADPLTAAGDPLREAPRAILKAQIDRLRGLGIFVAAASELEFYIVKESYAAAFTRGYRELSSFYHRHGDNDVMVGSLAAPFCGEVEQALLACGITVDQIQGEGGAGQLEVNMMPSRLLEAADNHVVFKHVVKAVAHRTGHAATFLAKFLEGDAGSGGHIHMSFTTSEGGNAFGSGHTLSAFGRSFVAGLVAFAPELTLLHAPYANSYKRLVPGAFTPLHATWGWDNRTVMVRLIEGSSGPRLEFRLPGADANPYHSYSAIIAAGLAGVSADLPLPPESNKTLSTNEPLAVAEDLTEATMRFSQSKLARDAFGPDVHRHLLQHALHELAATRRAVTNWEVARGFENA